MTNNLLVGLLIGTILGLVFTSSLTPHLPLIVIVTILVMGRVISFK